MAEWRFPLLAALFICSVGFRIIPPPPEGSDFYGFYAAAQLPAAHLYDRPVLPKVFHRPPFVALFFRAFACMPYAVAARAWSVFCGACIFGFLMLWDASPRACFFAAGFVPLWIAVAGGQDSPALLLVFAGGMRLIENKMPVCGGIVLALLADKPQLCFLLPLSLSGRARLGLAGGGLGLYVISALYSGWGWPLDLIAASRHYDAWHSYFSPGWYGLTAARWGPAIYGVTALGWSALLGRACARVRAGRARAALLLAGSVLLGYRPLLYDWSLLLPLGLAGIGVAGLRTATPINSRAVIPAAR